ncbi:hypothetical protein Plhal304r1_c018g0064151 [Plasmopara halstedii]
MNVESASCCWRCALRRLNVELSPFTTMTPHIDKAIHTERLSHYYRLKVVEIQH